MPENPTNTAYTYTGAGSLAGTYHVQYYAEILPEQKQPNGQPLDSLSYKVYNGVYYVLMPEYSQDNMPTLDAKTIAGLTNTTIRYTVSDANGANLTSASESGRYGALPWEHLLYTRNTVTFTYNMNGHGTAPALVSLKYGQSLTQLDVSVADVEGWEFKGWYKDPTGIQPYDFTGKAGVSKIIVYAKWEPTEVHVTFVDQDGSPLASDGTQTQGVARGGDINFNNLTIGGRVYDSTLNVEGKGAFNGWDWIPIDGAAKQAFPVGGVQIWEDTTLYARWKTTGLSLTYHQDNGTVLYVDQAGSSSGVGGGYNLGTQATARSGDELALQTDGRTFYGWQVQKEGMIYTPGSQITVYGNLHLYPFFGTDADLITVTYNPNFDPDAPADVTRTVVKNSSAQLLGRDTFQRTGWTLLGWTDEEGGTTVKYALSAHHRFGAEDVILYAVWVQNTYTVTYDGNGGTGDAPTDETEYHAGESVTVAEDQGTLEKDDYTFVGWSLSSDNDPSKVITKLEMPAEDVTLYAVWVPEETVVITFEPNGNPYYKRISNPWSISAANPRDKAPDWSGNSGWTFRGWNTNANGSGESYATNLDLPTYTNESVTYYAQWDKPAYTVTFLDWDGVMLSVQNVEYGESAMAPANPSRSGYTFTGWSSRDYINVTGNVTIRATYTPVPQPPVAPPTYPPSPPYPPVYPPVYPPYTPPAPPTTTIIDEPTPLAPGPQLFITDHVAYVIGYDEEDGTRTVRPQRNITRGEVATVFYRVLLDDVRNDNWSETNPFPDVNPEQFFYYPVSVMTEMGILNGYPEGEFRPDANITRAELAKIVAEFARLMNLEPTNDAEFTDISGHWAEVDILHAASVGWLMGDGDGTFRPNDKITRAEFMAIVNRILERAVNREEDLLPDMLRWSDNADVSAWYYFDVQEATNSHVYDRRPGQRPPNLTFEYEHWRSLIENRNWAALEEEWRRINAHS
jgi:uncharacterized repeat protein (TIGR02543 family)